MATAAVIAVMETLVEAAARKVHQIAAAALEPAPNRPLLALLLTTVVPVAKNPLAVAP